jgi:hypothetical protein
VSTINQLLAAFIAEHRTGGDADPRAFLDRAPLEEQRELAALMDTYLASAPRQAFTQSAFAGSSAELTVDAIERCLAGQAGIWPSMLPRLRSLAGLRRSDLVTQLAAALGLSGHERKVGSYYHQMEQGLLPSAGVSDRVLEALGRIVGETTEALRDAGRSLAGPSGGRPGTNKTFARRGAGVPRQDSSVPTEPDAGDWDEVDELFCEA